MLASSLEHSSCLLFYFFFFFFQRHQKLPLISLGERCSVRGLVNPDAETGDTQMYLYVEERLIKAEQSYEMGRQKRGETGQTFRREEE